MNQPFEPLNELERDLVAAQQNQMPVTGFLQTLQASKVFILIDREPGPRNVWDSGAAPMVLSNAGKTPFLALFTAPERAGEWSKRQTAFSVGLSTDFASLLEGMAPDLGIVINPGLQVGFEMQPSTVARLRTQAR